MRLSALLCASVLALGILALTADGAMAATTVSASKSNGSYKLDTKDANAAKKCTDAGGTVKTGTDGTKTCVMPQPAPAPATTPAPGH